jgi:hypothetical protein
LDRRDHADELLTECEGSSLPSALALIGIVGAVLLLMVLPAVIALRAVELPVEWVEAGLAVLGAVLGGVKLIAMAWGIGERFLIAHPAGAVAAAD